MPPPTWRSTCDGPPHGRFPGPWLPHLRPAGKPTITMDLAHMIDAPALDPRTWHTHGDGAPVRVAIDVLDEDHSLRLAMRRLAADSALRASLGAAGLRCWTREHEPALMIADYERLIRSPPPATPHTQTFPRTSWTTAGARAEGDGRVQAPHAFEVDFENTRQRRAARDRRPCHHQRAARHARIGTRVASPSSTTSSWSNATATTPRS